MNDISKSLEKARNHIAKSVEHSSKAVIIATEMLNGIKQFQINHLKIKQNGSN